MPNFTQIYANLNLLDWIFIIVSILALFPLYQSVKNYQRTGSRDYVIFTGIFLAIAIHFHTLPLFFQNYQSDLLYPTWISPLSCLIEWQQACLGSFLFIVVMIAMNSWMFFMFLHAIRLRWTWDEKPVVLWIIGVGMMALNMTLIIIRIIIDPNAWIPFLNEINRFFGSLIPLLTEIFRFIWIPVLLYGYITVQPSYSDQRIRVVRGIWIVYIISNVIVGIFDILSYLGLGSEAPQSQTWVNGVYILSIVATLLFFVLGVWFPEAMLISQALLVRATKLYDLVEQAQDFEPTQSRDYLLRYIQNLPPELLRELEPRLSTK